MKMLIDTVEGEDTLSSQMIASTSGNMIALRASSALEATILSQPKLFSFYWKMKLLSPRGGAKVKEFDTDHEVESRI